MTTTALEPVPHSLVEDVLAVAVGSFLVSLGVYLLEATGAVTGGAPGLALLLGHVLPVPFGVVYVALSVPFLVLAAARVGAGFTVRSVAAVGAVAAFSLLHPRALALEQVDVVYGNLVGHLAVGVGLVVLFRHDASLGGFGVVALLAQERLGWRAGWVQLAFDATIVLASLLVAPLGTVLLSVAGAVLLNALVALNHRPGRYVTA